MRVCRVRRVQDRFASGLSLFDSHWAMKSAPNCSTHISAPVAKRSETCLSVVRRRRRFKTFLVMVSTTEIFLRPRYATLEEFAQQILGNTRKSITSQKRSVIFLKNSWLTISCLSRIVFTVYLVFNGGMRRRNEWGMEQFLVRSFFLINW